MAFDGTDNPEPWWREWQSLFRLHGRGLHRQADYCGLFSVKVEHKIARRRACATARNSCSTGPAPASTSAPSVA